MIRELLPEFLPTNEEETNLWKFIQAHENELDISAEAAHDAIVSSQLNARSWGNWDSETTYQEGDIVSYDELNWEATDTTTDDRPDQSDAWKLYQNDNLDEIGALFGEVGRRRGRNDRLYRRYLRTLAQSFLGSGERRNVRRAIAAALLLDETFDDSDIEENIEIIELFNTLEYDILIKDWEPHNPEAIFEVAQIAEPSGVSLSEVRYQIPEDEKTVIGDEFTYDVGNMFDEIVQASDVTVSITDFDEKTVDNTSIKVSVTHIIPETYNEQQVHTDEITTIVRETYWDTGQWGVDMVWG